MYTKKFMFFAYKMGIKVTASEGYWQKYMRLCM